MSTAASTRTSRPLLRLPIPTEKGDEILGFLLGAVALLLFGSLASYHPLDPSWMHRTAEAGSSAGVRNLVGPIGAQLSALAFALVGVVAFSLPGLLAFEAWRRLAPGEPERVRGRAVGVGALLLVLPGLVQLLLGPIAWRGVEVDAGGSLGVVLSNLLAGQLDPVGAFVVLFAALLVATSLATRSSLRQVLAHWRDHASDLWGRINLARAQRDKRRRERSTRERVIRHARGERPAPGRSTERAASGESQSPTGLPGDVGAVRTPRVVRGGGDGGAIEPPPERSASSPSASRPEPPVRVQEKKGEGHFTIRKVRPTESPASSVPPASAPPPPPSASFPGASSPGVPPQSSRGAARSLGQAPPPAPVAPPEPRQEALDARPEMPELPPVNLLETRRFELHHDESELVRRGEIIQESCEHFGVAGEIAGISPGPVITIFEFQPAPGVKVSKVVNLQDDLALALKADSVRIDRMPGRSTLGMEVPNPERSVIHLGQLLGDEAFAKAKSPLTMTLGVDMHGRPVFHDLAKMPHLLVAGATGAGKSVGLQSMITSILYKSTKDDVKFIFIDPKRVELGVYSEIPHLKTEVVVEPKKAANALRWAVAEMERRYRLLAEVHVRSIDIYNRAIRDPEARQGLNLADGESEFSNEDLEPLPYYVIVIDELADLMMVSSSEVEASIARLAQMARAVGLHLIIATQRPSVDVLTGTIKANFPCRLAFATATRHDSRTILDTVGAEKLLGKGDALFMPPGTSRIMRLHGAYISEQETAALVRWLKRRGKPDLDPEVVKDPDEGVSAGAAGPAEDDPLFDEAARLVVAERQASASFLQRRMRVGFSRAARLVDMLEADGLLGPAQGSKPRDVLVPVDYFDEVDDHRESSEA